MSHNIRLERIDKFVWRIPKGAKPCMRVDAIIYADEYLLEKMRSDLTLVQAANVACLPGIQLASYVMPDGHQGYGFAIGGVAGFDVDEGVISPGGVGYDINCLPRGTRILTSLGYTIPIEEIDKGDEVYSVDENGVTIRSRVVLKLNRFESKLYKIITRSGYTIKASWDHPVLTSRGMINASEVRVGDKIAIYPFEGVPYEKPDRFTILESGEFRRGIRRELIKRKLLPLTSLNPKLPYLVKIYGYALGDGHIDPKTGKIILYGDRETLERIADDIRIIGYTPKIYMRGRHHRIGKYEFNTTEYSLHVKARSLVELFIKLGYPIGRKVEREFHVPKWLFKLPLWIKRLFLATYFDAEASTPKAINGYNFYMPEIKVAKKMKTADNAVEFLEEIKKLLEEFGVKSTIREACREKDRVVYRLLIHSKPDNLIRFYSRIGFEYNYEKKRRALGAIVYLKLKEKVKALRGEARRKAREASTINEAVRVLEGNGLLQLVNRRFIERSVYENVSDARIPRNYISYEEFLEENVVGEIVYDEVEKVELVEYNDYVYDFMVDRDEHNFIADNIVVSNCGVRVLRTNLDEEDVRPRLKELVDTLFRNVPSGVGATGKLRLSFQELDEVLNRGVEWAVEHGFGWEEDMDHIEEHGSWKLADASKVSHRAKRRGHNQLGTLGAGNHFLEVQVVDKIYDPSIAKVMGITHEGQVTVMIHTGSRGLGHQVASDYLLIMERAMRKYGIRPPDRELASLPFKSPEAQNYVRAMAAAANFAWTNRQLIMHWVRESFRKVFHKAPEDLGMKLIYDVAHNIAKIEEHIVDGKKYRVVVHRKGATRAFPPGHPEIPDDYKSIGQPVLIPGSMGTASYILVGTKEGVRTWHSAPHGAGRWMSRHAAIRTYRPERVVEELSRKGIVLRAATRRVISEEAPGAYKDVDKVVFVAHNVGIAKLVVRLRPLGVVKG